MRPTHLFLNQPRPHRLKQVHQEKYEPRLLLVWCHDHNTITHDRLQRCPMVYTRCSLDRVMMWFRFVGGLSICFGPIFCFGGVMVYTNDVAPIRAEMAGHDPSRDFSSVAGGCLVTSHEFGKAASHPAPSSSICPRRNGLLSSISCTLFYFVMKARTNPKPATIKA